MTLRQDIEAYREPKTGLIAIHPKPKDRSEDNLLLFSATYLALLKILGGGPTECEAYRLFHENVPACEIEPGLLARYPGERVASSWDDHVAVASVAAYLGASGVADRIFLYAVRNDYTFQGRFLGRIGDFAPTLKASARVPLNIVSQIQFAGALLFNCFQSREETSGRCLFYLKQLMIHGRYPLIDAAFSVWRYRMMRLFPGGVRELYGVYFKPKKGNGPHPFAVYAPTDFSPPAQ